MKAPKKYINLLTDFGIKKIFGPQTDKRILLHFLNNLFENEFHIADLRHLPTEHLGEKRKDRIAIFDLYCELSSGERILIELQIALCQFRDSKISKEKITMFHSFRKVDFPFKKLKL